MLDKASSKVGREPYIQQEFRSILTESTTVRQTEDQTLTEKRSRDKSWLLIYRRLSPGKGYGGTDWLESCVSPDHALRYGTAEIQHVVAALPCHSTALIEHALGPVGGEIEFTERNE